MKNFVLAFFASMLLTLTSFGGPPSIMKDHGIKTPVDSFGFVIVLTFIKDINCDEKDCEYEQRIATASSVVVLKTKNITRLLTAGHVCAAVEDGPTHIVIKDFYGKSHDAAAQVYSEKPDICLVETIDSWGTPLKISRKNPEHGDHLWNMASPFGIFNESLLLTFEGIYSGKGTDESDWYTIPAAPGSSGSPIINHRGEIVGIIHSAFMNLPHIAISSSTEQIRSFLKKANYELDFRQEDEKVHNESSQ